MERSKQREEEAERRLSAMGDELARNHERQQAHDTVQQQWAVEERSRHAVEEEQQRRQRELALRVEETSRENERLRALLTEHEAALAAAGGNSSAAEAERERERQEKERLKGLLAEVTASHKRVNEKLIHFDALVREKDVVINELNSQSAADKGEIAAWREKTDGLTNELAAARGGGGSGSVGAVGGPGGR